MAYSYWFRNVIIYKYVILFAFWDFYEIAKLFKWLLFLFTYCKHAEITLAVLQKIIINVVVIV